MINKLSLSMYQPMSNSSKATKKEGHLSAAPLSESIYIYGVKLDPGTDNPGSPTFNSQQSHTYRKVLNPA
jgi:hypothetical protein